MIYSRHMGSQSKPFTRLSLNHASQQDSVHIKAAHGSPKRPQKSPSPVHSIKWEFPPERKGLDSHVASGILIKQKCSKTFSVSIHGKISWIRFIKTDIFIQQTHSKIKANFSSKPGGAGAGGAAGDEKLTARYKFPPILVLPVNPHLWDRFSI